MRRLTVFRLVVLLPVVCAILFALRHAYIAGRQTEAIAIFERALSNGESLPYSRLIADFGPARSREHFARASKHRLVDFDGKSRIVQITKDGIEYQIGTLDLLELHDFSDGCSTAVHQPPVGTRIKTARFAGDGVDVTLFGDLQINGSVVRIPEDAPETYHLSWPVGSPPTNPPLSKLIETRKRPL